ncbi:MAG: M50 family metallopeptidase [bacterium]|nr:M50 family metallopeptidase [bacterium]
MLAIITFIIVLGLLVFVHEAGHFVVAKRAGMGVEEFGFGFPPRIIGIQKVDGRWRVMSRKPIADSRKQVAGGPTSTIYSLNWVPLGGFVRITGENGGDTNDPRSFSAKPRWQRALVLVAGVAMNVVLAVSLFTAVYLFGAPQVLDGLPPGAKVRNQHTAIVGVLKDGPAVAAGFQPGDSVIAIDGQSFVNVLAVQQYIREHTDRSLRITIEREGDQRVIDVQPALLPGGTVTGIGVQLVEVGTVRFPPHLALWYGIRTTGNVMVDILKALGGLFRGLVVDHAVTVDIAGPVGIAVMTGQVVRLGFIHLLQFTAVLSANLALLNVFPFPALDGGRLFLLGIEAIRRRALTRKIENAIHAAGFIVLLLLVVAVTYRDIVVFGGGILGSLKAAVGLE